MHIFKEIEPLRAFLDQKKGGSGSLGLVPTMGALHAGHLSLIATSKAENQFTVCSIYVNPTQFNNAADLEKYPRTIEKDIALLESGGCDILFAPDNTSMYPGPSSVKLDFGGIDKILEGEFRPGHFSGVGLVVSKLFNIVQPDRAYFGQKDFQQFAVVSKLREELSFQIELRCIPTMRESDGLAMSSRNVRLSTEERKNAIVFFQSFDIARRALVEGKKLTEVHDIVKQHCERAHGIKLEYFAVANSKNLMQLENVRKEDNAIMLIAGFAGEVRLIDNMFLQE